MNSEENYIQVAGNGLLLQPALDKDYRQQKAKDAGIVWPRGGPFCEEGVGSRVPLTVCKRTGMLQGLLG